MLFQRRVFFNDGEKKDIYTIAYTRERHDALPGGEGQIQNSQEKGGSVISQEVGFYWP